MFGRTLPGKPDLIHFLLLPGFSMMAFASSIEPLRAANQIAGRKLFDWRTVTIDGKPVKASNGVETAPGGCFADPCEASTLLICAGLGVGTFHHPQLAPRLRELARNGVALGGICTGALPLARAGLLDGYRCTIHWESVEPFAEEFPHLNITATLFEADGNRYTCSGGTAPLDMMVGSIAQDYGKDLAVRVAEMLLHHSVRHPHDAQRMSLEHRTGITHPKLLAVIAHMEAYIESPTPVAALADSVQLSKRQLERLFRDRLGTTPTRYYLELRLQRARLLMQETSMPILHVGVATGFTSSSHFTRCYRAYFGVSPRAERLSLRRIFQFT
ncbi:MAG: GlxA family transcriptional regulator [Pseudomonadota bacterium]